MPCVREVDRTCDEVAYRGWRRRAWGSEWRGGVLGDAAAKPSTPPTIHNNNKEQGTSIVRYSS